MRSDDFIIDGNVGVRLKVKRTSISAAELETLLKQVIELLKKPYSVDEEPLIDINCKINGIENSSYQLGFALTPNKSLGLYIKRKDGKLFDKNTYMTLEMNQNDFTVREKNLIKDFIERSISYLIGENELREAAEAPSRYQTY